MFAKNCHLRPLQIIMLIVVLTGVQSCWAERPALGKGLKSNLSTMHMERRNGALLFFGTSHTFDPADQQIADMEELWRKFEPDVVLIEGGDWPVAGSKREAIEKYGETGFAKFFANQTGTLAQNAELPDREDMKGMLAFFTPSQVKLYYILRRVPQWNREADPRPICEKLAAFLNSGYFQNVPVLAGTLNSVEDVEKATNDLLPGLGDWRKATYEWVNPIGEKSFLNVIAKKSSEMRDRYMARQIVELVQLGKRVAVVAGAAHLAAQQPMLTNAFFSRTAD